MFCVRQVITTILYRVFTYFDLLTPAMKSCDSQPRPRT